MTDFRRILITGGTGCIGYTLYQYLRKVDPDLDVWTFSRRTGGDVRNAESVNKAVEGKDLVIHLAAQSHVDFSINGTLDEKREFIDTNITGTLHVIDACRKHKAKMIHMSTSEVYGTSQTPGVPMTEDHPLLAQAGTYAVSKAAADLLCRMGVLTSDLDCVILRGFNQWGAAQSCEKVIPRFINQAHFGYPLTIYGSGEQRRDYVNTWDTAAAIWAARNIPSGTICNIGTERSYSINELADMIIKACGNKSIKIHADHTQARPAEVKELNGSYQKLNKLTGWEPTIFLPDGIQLVTEWYLANGAIQPPKLTWHG